MAVVALPASIGSRHASQSVEHVGVASRGDGTLGWPRSKPEPMTGQSRPRCSRPGAVRSAPRRRWPPQRVLVLGQERGEAQTGGGSCPTPGTTDPAGAPGARIAVSRSPVEQASSASARAPGRARIACRSPSPQPERLDHGRGRRRLVLGQGPGQHERHPCIQVGVASLAAPGPPLGVGHGDCLRPARQPPEDIVASPCRDCFDVLEERRRVRRSSRRGAEEATSSMRRRATRCRTARHCRR